MQHETLDSRFLFPNPLTCLGDFLVNFSERAHFPMVVRSVEDNMRDKKILLHNKAAAITWGLEDKGMEGMKYSDFVDISPPFEAQLGQMQKGDQEAADNKDQSTYIQHIVFPSGFVYIFQRVTSPVYGQRKKLVALSTVSLDLTQYTSLIYLFDLYKKYHPKNGEAAAKISAYLALGTFLSPGNSLTPAECRVLFAMEQLCQYKQIAVSLNTTVSNVTSLVGSIKDKLKPNLELSMVVSSLRNSRRWQPPQPSS